MIKKESSTSWIALIAILVFTALFAAVWPALTGGHGTAVSIPSETQYVEITNPINSEIVELAAWQAMAMMFVVIAAATVAVGVGITLVNKILDKQVHNVIDSDEFKKSEATLAQTQKEKNKQKMEGRETGSASNSYRKWTVASTALLILLLTAVGGQMVARTIWPTGEIIRDSQILNIGSIFIGIVFLLVGLFLVWKLRADKIQAVDETDKDDAPWAFMWVLFSGFLIVGLGIGTIVYLN